MKKCIKVFKGGVLFAAMISVLFCGCQNKNKNEAIQNDIKEKETTIITIWTKDRHDAEFQKKKIEEYNITNTDNIRIKYEIYADNYAQAVDRAFQTGNVPDIFVSSTQIFTKYVNQGKYADLISFMDDAFQETFSAAMIDGINVLDGKCYYVPTAATVSRLFYNKSIFARCGIENPPVTLQEMVKDATIITEQLSGEGIYGFAANMKNANSGLNRNLLKQANAELGNKTGFDFNKGEYDFSGYKSLIEVWRTLMSSQCGYPESQFLDIDPLRKLFSEGKIGMYISYSHAELGAYEQQYDMQDEWGCVEIPVTDGIMRGAQNYNSNNGYLFYSGSPHLEEAWKAYRAVFANVDNLTEYYEQGLGVSIIPKVIENANVNQFYKENPALSIGKNDKMWPPVPTEVNPEGVIVDGMDLYDTLKELIFSSDDIDTVLKDLTQRYNIAYYKGVKEGTGILIKIDHFNPMNPSGV